MSEGFYLSNSIYKLNKVATKFDINIEGAVNATLAFNL